ncbi:hypothetical protein MRS44_018482 [Fusarium solani]|uniref:uncharacterized protein n=1 Tax=Fusarium solani TaxID=169388 RepID=UPI0032C4828F|nr:hypothetical protein MRS44_018482 [Fusarium solani]
MSSTNGPRDSLSEYEFSFEAYLDYSTGIEVDSNPWSRPTLDTASVAESIYEFHKENGRTYHAYRAGWKTLHARFLISPQDPAAGLSIWEMSFPKPRIIGTDLSPIQSDLVPPNVEFIIDDATDEWPQGRDWCNFDLIHTRVTMGCWSDMAKQIIQPAFERLKPGGWIECQELEGLLECDDGSVKDNAFKKWCDDIVDASITADRPLPGAASMKQAFIEAGFVDIHEKIYKIPINGWPKDCRLKRFGELWHANVVEGLQALSYGLLHRVKGMTKEEIEVNLVDRDPDSFERETFTEAAFQVEKRKLRLWRKQGAVGKLHNIVRFVRTSPQRRELMKSLACGRRDEDDYQLFGDVRAAIDLKLMQNNETKWNLTFLMIQRAIRKREQIDHFITYLDTKAAEPRQRVPVQDPLSQQDWLLLAEVAED